MPASAVRTSAMASEGRGCPQQRLSGRPARGSASTGRRPQKAMGWTGVRQRRWGGWAMEIRIPRTRLKLWIGRFQNAIQAALAYDAAMVCLYGERLPGRRKFNCPVGRHPAIPDHVRIHLTIATIKVIAADYGRRCAAFLAPLVCHPIPETLSAPPVMATLPSPDGAEVFAEESAFLAA